MCTSYLAVYRCEKGHKFEASGGCGYATNVCPICYPEWAKFNGNYFSEPIDALGKEENERRKKAWGKRKFLGYKEFSNVSGAFPPKEQWYEMRCVLSYFSEFEKNISNELDLKVRGENE